MTFLQHGARFQIPFDQLEVKATHRARACAGEKNAPKVKVISMNLVQPKIAL